VQDHYDRFPYPDARFLVAPAAPDAARLALEWDVGWGSRARFPRPLRIWVAGCGTVQASEIALRHPDATLLATDLSEHTLERAEAIAAAAGVAGRIEFVRHDLSEPLPRAESFDLIDCVGVLHHLPEPRRGLATLRTRLAAQGVIDLMVYQDSHRVVYRRFQEALRAMLGDNLEGAEAFDLAVALARDLATSERSPASVREALAPLADIAEQRPAWFADTLLHPLEHGFSPATVTALAEGCGLAFAGFAFPELWDPRLYLRAPDALQHLGGIGLLRRAEALTLLLGDNAPFLDLYLAHQDAPAPRPPDDETLLAGTLRPHGPWLRRELVDDRPAPPRRLGAEPSEGGGLLVRGPRGATRVGPDAAALLEMVGSGAPVQAALDAFSSRRGVPAGGRAALLGFVRRLLGPSARLFVFEPPGGPKVTPTPGEN